MKLSDKYLQSEKIRRLSEEREELIELIENISSEIQLLGKKFEENTSEQWILELNIAKAKSLAILRKKLESIENELSHCEAESSESSQSQPGDN